MIKFAYEFASHPDPQCSGKVAGGLVTPPLFVGHEDRSKQPEPYNLSATALFLASSLASG